MCRLYRLDDLAENAAGQKRSDSVSLSNFHCLFSVVARKWAPGAAFSCTSSFNAGAPNSEKGRGHAQLGGNSIAFLGMNFVMCSGMSLFQISFQFFGPFNLD